MLLKENNVNEFTESIYDSSNLFKSIYNNNKKELFLFFKRGGVYLYSPVSKELFEDFQKAESQGKFFHANIKNNSKVSWTKAFTMFDWEKATLNEQIRELRKEKHQLKD